ncbi:MAG TPA: hypothetical protein VJO52_02585 [Gemmatimonadaceae bacterium]|nr:hypothetical protein [Gemmatimonadaceae bacterium]
MTERKRRILWTIAVIVAFIIGFLLGLRYCRMRSGGEGGGVILGRGQGSGSGSPEKLGKGSGSGTASGGGYLKTPVDTTDAGSGNAAGSGAGGGDAGSGNSSGNSNTPFDSGEFKKKPKPVDTLSTEFVARLSGDLLAGRGPKDPPAPPGPTVNTKTADDFSLDQTALPRFPMDVTRAFSSVSTRSDIPRDTGTATAFATSDSYDSVTSWYSHHMPAGSHETKFDVNEMKSMAKQLSPKNIMKMFGIQKDSQTASDTAASDTAATDTTAAGDRVSGWDLPDDGVHGKRSVMVISSPGKPTTIIMSRSRRP